MKRVEEYFKARRADVDSALEAMLPSPPTCPTLIAEVMRYSLFAGGKRLRPILTFAAAETTGGVTKDEIEGLARPSACAVEMIHTYSLIHDDLPAMDNDTLRRGRPTAHVVYGDGLAILAGDGLLTEAFRVLARWPESNDLAIITRKREVIERVAEAAGVVGMVGGQAIDLQAVGQVSNTRSTGNTTSGINAETLRAMHERKTGALIRAAAVTGAIMVGASEAQVNAVDSYAAHLGLGFQIIDDILDIQGAQDSLGKTTGKDAAAGKPTYPAMFGLQKSQQLAAQAIAEAKNSIRQEGLSGRLDEIADWVLARTH